MYIGSSLNNNGNNVARKAGLVLKVAYPKLKLFP